LADCHGGIFQQIARDLEADLVGHLPERAAFGLQVPVHGAAMHRETKRDRGARAEVPEDLGSKQLAQVLSEQAEGLVCL
jgi:hypothetical protein